MLSIDKAIAQEREIAKEQKTKYDKCPTRMKYCCEMCFHNPKCNEVAEYHEQLAEWLEELKVYQQHEIVCHKGYNAGYNKAIDDFVEKVELEYLGVHPDELCEKYYPSEICKQIKELAEQLKVGERE